MSQASEAGIVLIRSAMKQDGWTQIELCNRLKFCRSTLNQILKGSPVRPGNLDKICDLLELEIGQVLLHEANSDINCLVEQLRKSSEKSLQARCGTMRILDMTQPIDSGAIYTDVNILERVAAKTRRQIQDLMLEGSVEQFDRFLLGGRQERVKGSEAVLDKKLLMILGRPGAGKTTFLKRLAIVCLKGEFLADRLPIFVTLKEFAEAEGKPGILDFIAGGVGAKYSSEKSQRSQIIGLPNASPSPGVKLKLIEILESDRALVLLDGLDEVMEKDHDQVIREIREFAEKYDQNHIVITCRIAAREYIFQQFTEVEMADFDDDQIQLFAGRWFETKENNPKSTTG